MHLTSYPSSTRTQPSRGPLALALVALAATSAPAQVTKTIDVTDSRPLSAAIDVLEDLTGVAINYEDPPYENGADLQDVSTPQQKAARPGYQLLVPRIGQMAAQVQLTGPGNSEGDASSGLNLLLSSYRQNGLPDDFSIEQANGMLYVVPTKVLGSNGVFRAVTSPLTTPVNIPYAKRTVADTAQAIFDAVYSGTGLRVVVGAFPFRPTDTIGFGASAESARDALADLLSELPGRPYSYRLTFDPRPDIMRSFDYMINIRQAGYTVPSAPTSGAVPLLPPAPANQSGSRPGMVKKQN